LLNVFLEEMLENYKEFVVRLIASPVMNMALSGDLRYVAINLKKLHRGLPLLPALNQRDDMLIRPLEWEEADADLNLTHYLRIFLFRLGHPELAGQIYDRLDCRKVLRYQAIMRASVWVSIWTVLETPFAEQRAAYRRLRGGTHAPVLQSGEPRFEALLEDRQRDLAHRVGLARGAVASVGLRISKTFLEVSANLDRPKRCNSSPNI
jgi:hypothetical protein